MGNTTEISWTHWPDTTGRVWNPTRGCSRVSPGCGGAKGVGGCYAERQAYRFSQPTAATPHPPYEGLVQLGKQGPRWTGKVPLIVDKLSEPLGWRGRSTVFVNSMSDLMHDALSDAEIDQVFGIMAACPQHTFIVLTKRAERLRNYGSQDRRGQWARAACARTDGDDMLFDAIALGPRALPNVVLGVSVENQEWADKRIPELLATPAACRMVSYEPALGGVDFDVLPANLPELSGVPNRNDYFSALTGLDYEPQSQEWSAEVRYPRLDWVVLGGESGPGSRPFDIKWARSTVAACQAAGVPVYVKQLGRRPVDSEYLNGVGVYAPEDKRSIAAAAALGCVDCPPKLVMLHDGKGADWSEWPENLRVRELPAISRRHDRASVSLTAAHGSTDDGSGSFSMMSLEASGGADVVGAAIDMALGLSASMRGAP